MFYHVAFGLARVVSATHYLPDLPATPPPPGVDPFTPLPPHPQPRLRSYLHTHHTHAAHAIDDLPSPRYLRCWCPRWARTRCSIVAVPTRFCWTWCLGNRYQDYLVKHRSVVTHNSTPHPHHILRFLQQQTCSGYRAHALSYATRCYLRNAAWLALFPLPTTYVLPTHPTPSVLHGSSSLVILRYTCCSSFNGGRCSCRLDVTRTLHERLVDYY